MLKIKLPEEEKQKANTGDDIILEMNENIRAILKEILKLQSEEISEQNRETIKEIIGKADLIITECHTTKKFHTPKNEDFNRLAYEYQRLNLKFESYQISQNIKETMEKATKLEEESIKRAKQLEEVKNEQKTMIATIISIVLAISIIPTGIAGIEHIGGNYVLPFLASIVTFGLIMIAFTYSLYQTEFKKRIIVFLALCMLGTVGLWYISFNFNISVTPKNNNEVIENQTSDIK